MLVAKDERRNEVLDCVLAGKKAPALLLIVQLEEELARLPQGLARELALTSLNGVRHWVLRT